MADTQSVLDGVLQRIARIAWLIGVGSEQLGRRYREAKARDALSWQQVRVRDVVTCDWDPIPHALNEAGLICENPREVPMCEACRGKGWGVSGVSGEVEPCVRCLAKARFDRG